MDTKWKKCKLVISYASFVAALCLLLAVLLMGSGLLAAMKSIAISPADAFQGDYQDTKAFRQYISYRLEDFIMMAAGGSPGASVGTAYASDTGVSEETAAEVWEETAGELTTTQGRRELHNALKDDKNMLYTISYDGDTLYSNAEEGTLDGSAGKMPKGYNFLLYFDGSKVYLQKDGKTIDVYGDGYYRENSDWKVPGYHNFTTDNKSKKASVTIAAAKTPRFYMKADYSSYGEESVSNRLYRLNQDLYNLRSLILFFGVLTALFAASLILAVRWRKQIKSVNQLIAAKTKKIWVEVKAVLCLGSLLLLIIACTEVLRELYWSLHNSYDVVYEYDYYVFRITGSIWTWLSYLSVILVCVWILFFLGNDIRYNKNPLSSSLLRSLWDYIYRMFRSKGAGMPVQKKIVFRYLPAFLGEGMVVSLLLLLGFRLYYSGTFYGANICLYLLALTAAGLTLAAQFWYIWTNRAAAEDIEALTQQICRIKEGNIAAEVSTLKDPDLAEAAKNLNDIRNGLDIAVQEQIKSERMKVELVSNVSHDIKTPLTSIISYVDLMNQEPDLPEHVKDYVKILESKSQRLKSMVQDVFEISKAASRQLPVNIDTLDLGKLIRQTLADMSESIERSTLSIKTRIPEEPVLIKADGQRLYRVFQNLLQNALQYSMEHSRIFITLETDGTLAAVSVKNISRYELPERIDYTERFVRGDESRSDGGSGLGLSIAKSFVEACRGSFRIDINADLFMVTVEFRDITSTTN